MFSVFLAIEVVVEDLTFAPALVGAGGVLPSLEMHSKHRDVCAKELDIRLGCARGRTGGCLPGEIGGADT